MSFAAALLAAALLPPVIADPRSGPSPWREVAADAVVDGTAPGYLVHLPERPDDAWLRATFALGGSGAALAHERALGFIPLSTIDRYTTSSGTPSSRKILTITGTYLPAFVSQRSMCSRPRP